MKKSKLTVVTHDEKYLQRLTNCLRGEKDISLLSTTHHQKSQERGETGSLPS
ncbi:MAG: hypothetical protein MZV70_53925 [Desulfobacterales bacterium]|nr:hypothetical protein [Desulfobacterales bacterium]